jgi:glycosyltransferase involved in cell wall biosynthesis
MTGARERLDILIVSNLWPPEFVGGYELGASEVARRLEARGHRITVLTSTYGKGPERDGRVARLLYEQVRWRPQRLRRLLIEGARSAAAIPRVRRWLRESTFDLVYLFNPLGLDAALVQSLGDLGRPVVAYVSDDWVARWPSCDRLYAAWMDPALAPAGPRRLVVAIGRRVLARAGVLTREPSRLPFEHAQWVSRFVQGLSRPHARPRSEHVIPWGIDVSRFRHRDRTAEELTRWLYVGQIEEHKGAHVAIDAVRLLRDRREPVTLTLVGDDRTGFASALARRVAADGLAPFVYFAGRQPHERLWEEAYDRGGVLVFPSQWDEPFSITLLEAFASGLPVIATRTGGTGELVRDGENATVVDTASAEHLATQWSRLAREPDAAVRMARRARALVEQQFDLDRMVDRVERHLLDVAGGERT